MRHPLEAVTGGRRLGAAGVLFAIALAVRAKMQVDARTRAAPYGMMSFALARDPTAARRIVASWDRRTRRQAHLNLRLDPLFSLAWTTAIALADLRAARALRRRGWPGAGAGVPLAWGQWLAAALAGAKDAALLALLRGRTERPLPRVARWCTATEIGLKGAGLAYAAAGGLARLLGLRRRADRRRSLSAPTGGRSTHARHRHVPQEVDVMCTRCRCVPPAPSGARRTSATAS